LIEINIEYTCEIKNPLLSIEKIMENVFTALYDYLNHLIRSRVLESTFDSSNPSGLLILFFLAAITDIGIPIPFVLDSILLLTAYRVWAMHDPHWSPMVWIIIMLFSGRQLGSGILYLISRSLGKIFYNWTKRRVPSVGNRLDSFCGRLSHWAPLAVTTGRLTPGLLQVTTVAAGLIRLRFIYFVLGVALSSVIYDGILVLLGFITAHSPRAHDANFTLLLLISLIVVVCILWPIVFIVTQRRRKSSTSAKC
jgi:membrane protein DedA with SNARE-associated domain